MDRREDLSEGERDMLRNCWNVFVVFWSNLGVGCPEKCLRSWEQEYNYHWWGEEAGSCPTGQCKHSLRVKICHEVFIHEVPVGDLTKPYLIYDQFTSFWRFHLECEQYLSGCEKIKYVAGDRCVMNLFPVDLGIAEVAENQETRSSTVLSLQLLLMIALWQLSSSLGWCHCCFVVSRERVGCWVRERCWTSYNI